jgi:hypothetical protein
VRDPDRNVIELLLGIVRPKQIRAERETQAITDAMATFRDKAKYSARFMFQAEGPYLVEDKEQYYMSRLRIRGI